nr:filamentous hemagglutinin N-terminal domain-containing protein [bacterium]
MISDKLKKIVVTVLLVISGIDIGLPVSAEMVTSGNVLNNVGNGGANLQNISGANVNTNYTNATVTNTAKTSILNWNSLNTGSNQSLKYVFPNKYGSQYSFNKVVGVGISDFAGSLTSEGTGRVIIANPNGILFENGSYTDVNALTLTTHKATLIDNDLTLDGSATNAKVQIGGYGLSNNVAQMKVANDLNIVSNNIDISSARITAKNVNLVTLDGITYFEINAATTPMSQVNAVNTKNLANDGNVSIKNSTFDLVKDNTTGKMFIVSKGALGMDTVTVNGAINANVSKADIVAFKGTNGVFTINSDDSISLVDSSFDRYYFTAKKDSSMTNVNQTGKDSYMKVAGKIDVKNSNFNKSYLTATNDVTVADTTFAEGGVSAKNIKSTGSSYTNTSLQAYDKVDAQGQYFDKAYVQGKNVDVSNSTIVNGSDIEGTNVNANGVNTSVSLLVADNNLSVEKANLVQSSAVSKGNVEMNDAVLVSSNLTSKNTISTSGITLNNSTLKTTKGAIALKAPDGTKVNTIIGKSTLDANGAVSIKQASGENGDLNIISHDGSSISLWADNNTTNTIRLNSVNAVTKKGGTAYFNKVDATKDINLVEGPYSGAFVFNSDSREGSINVNSNGVATINSSTAAKNINLYSAKGYASVANSTAGNLISVTSDDCIASISNSNVKNGNIIAKGAASAYVSSSTATGDILVSTARGKASVENSSSLGKITVNGKTQALVKISSAVGDMDVTSLDGVSNVIGSVSTQGKITVKGKTNTLIKDSAAKGDILGQAETGTSTIQGTISGNGTIKAIANGDVIVSDSDAYGNLEGTSNSANVNMKNVTSATGDVKAIAYNDSNIDGASAYNTVMTEAHNGESTINNASGNDVS